MKRVAIALCLALGVMLAGCAKTKPGASQAKPNPAPAPTVSHANAKPVTAAKERTALKPVAPVEHKTAAPAAEHKTAGPTASKERGKTELEQSKTPLTSPAKQPAPEQKGKESTPAPKP